MSEKSFEQEYQRLAASDIQLPKNEAVACDITCIEVEDDRSGMAIETLRRAITDNLYCIRGKDERFATAHDYYVALAHSVRDRLLHRRIQTAKVYAREDAKTVYYLSAEFLMGRHLANGLINLGIFESVREVLQDFGLTLEDLIEQEGEPGLGNGGLGRLAACFLDSLATLEVPAIGYGIRYEYGIFKQAIQNCEQIEIPDKWLSFGNPWEIARPEYRVEVKLGGYTEPYIDARGHYRVRWVPGQKISGVPHDMPIPGYGNNTVNTLRLWKAEASEEFDLQAFNAGDYFGAVADKTISENISKVLYPNDTTPQGKQLRLEQQYFFVSCSLQDIVRLHLRTHPNLDNFQAKAAIQLNDTHPAVAIAELLRLLVDEHEYDWDRAWAISQQTFAYTNHTLLPEALEKWSVELFGRLLPRHLEIIYEINHRFLAAVRLQYPGDSAKLERMSLIEEGPVKQVRMANLACVGSHKVNGVAALHTELLKRDVLHDFYDLWPEKFVNVTNGVTPRRWLMLSNPNLAHLISETIGSSWPAHLDELRQLAAYAEDGDFCDRWYQVKQANKEALAKYIWERNGIETDLGSIFDIQVKRIHEYKRQL
ncbi:MAG: glycogen/starch/alpha-glucan family phosphorylase, partial [Cyanobacteria bacterium J06641_5]